MMQILEIIAATGKSMDLHSGITGIWDQTIQAGAPLLTASSNGYLQSGLAEPNEFSACLRTFHAFSSITLPNCFILFFLFFVLFWFSVYAHFKQPQYPA